MTARSSADAVKSTLPDPPPALPDSRSGSEVTVDDLSRTALFAAVGLRRGRPTLHLTRGQARLLLEARGDLPRGAVQSAPDRHGTRAYSVGSQSRVPSDSTMLGLDAFERVTARCRCPTGSEPRARRVLRRTDGACPTYAQQVGEQLFERPANRGVFVSRSASEIKSNP